MMDPLLCEVACGGGEVDAADHSSIAYIVSDLAAIYGLTKLDLDYRLPRSNQRKFYNSVLQTKRKLEAQGDLAVQPNKIWRITNQGLGKVKTFCINVLKGMDEIDLQRFLTARDENGRDLFLSALNRVPTELHGGLIARSDSYQHLFVAAVEHIPLAEVGALVCSIFENTKDLLFERHVQRYRRGS